MLPLYPVEGLTDNFQVDLFAQFRWNLAGMICSVGAFQFVDTAE